MEEQSLDLLLRGRGPARLDRARAVLSERRALVVALVALVLVSALVAALLVGGAPAQVTLPRTGAEPAGGTEAPPGSSAVGNGTAPVAERAAPGSAPNDTGSTASSPSGSGGATHLVVHVAGAVLRPGLVDLAAGARVADAITAAGGLRPDADGDRLNLAQPVADGERVYVPVIGQAVTPAPVAVDGGPLAPSGGAGGAGGTAGAPSAPVDLNTATIEQLDALPGVGPATAAAIVAYRDQHGPFRSVEALDDVRGIGPAKFEALSSLVTVGP